MHCVQLDAPVVSKAFLKHDLPTLRLHCGPELLERFSGIFRHFTEQVCVCALQYLKAFYITGVSTLQKGGNWASTQRGMLLACMCGQVCADDCACSLIDAAYAHALGVPLHACAKPCGSLTQ